MLKMAAASPRTPMTRRSAGCVAAWAGEVMPPSYSLFEAAVAQPNHFFQRRIAVPARLHALNKSSGHAVVAGSAQLLQRQTAVSRFLERPDVRRIDTMITRLDQVLGVRGRVARFLHVRDVVPVHTVIAQA